MNVQRCQDCRWFNRTLARDACVCPSQPKYADRAGAGFFPWASTVRLFDCKGAWFEARPSLMDRVMAWLAR